MFARALDQAARELYAKSEIFALGQVYGIKASGFIRIRSARIPLSSLRQIDLYCAHS
jgi:hypothetical protein